MEYHGLDSDQQHYIENASLEKKDSYYIMKLNFITPVVYDKEEVENAYELAQQNGQNTFNGYTFYKDNKLPVNEENEHLIELYNEEYEHVQESIITAIKDDRKDLIFIFKRTPNNNDKYYVFYRDPSFGSIVFEPEKEIEVLLDPNDKMTITRDRDLNETIGKELSVEEYYKKAIDNEVSSENLISGFEYSLSSVGNSIRPWGNTNAVNFNDGCVNVSFHYGGI